MAFTADQLRMLKHVFTDFQGKTKQEKEEAMKLYEQVLAVVDPKKPVVVSKGKALMEVFESIQQHAVEFIEEGDALSINWVDVNAEVNEQSLDDYFKTELTKKGFDPKKIGFNYGDGHWMTVYFRK